MAAPNAGIYGSLDRVVRQAAPRLPEVDSHPHSRATSSVAPGIDDTAVVSGVGGERHLITASGGRHVDVRP